MSEYNASLKLQSPRRLRGWERDVLVRLVCVADLPLSMVTPDALDVYRVREMPDGGMGSLRFQTRGGQGGAHFTVAECWYTDVDGVSVSFTLNLDDDLNPWEIDVWKVDNSPLRGAPSAGDLRAAP